MDEWELSEGIPRLRRQGCWEQSLSAFPLAILFLLFVFLCCYFCSFPQLLVVLVCSR